MSAPDSTMEADQASTSALFTPARFGEIELANRVVMAPLTRMRSGATGVPGDLNVEHYCQRAGFGLIVAEATYPSFESQSFVGGPGIATDEQAAGWARVAAAVHSAGGRIVLQIMHGGRTSHPDVNGGRRVVAPSAIAIPGPVHTEKGKQPHVTPQPMTHEDIAAAIDDFEAAARRAVAAGMDGVEVHAANGYLLHQFLAPSANQRTDEYGGSPANRARFAGDVITRVAEAIGAGRVGVRISPENRAGGIVEDDRDDVIATYGALMDSIRPLGLAYLSVLHQDADGNLVAELQRRFAGALITNSGFASPTTLDDAERYMRAPFVDAVAVGRAAIANPDLVERWEHGYPENPLRPETVYSDGAEGYTDYPALAGTTAAHFS